MADEDPRPDDRALLSDGALKARLTRIERLLRSLTKLSTTSNGELPDAADPPILDAIASRIEAIQNAHASWTPYADKIASLQDKVTELQDILEGVDAQELGSLGRRAEELARTTPDADSTAQIIRRLEDAEAQIAERQEEPSVGELSARLDEVEDELATNLSDPESRRFTVHPPYHGSIDDETESEALGFFREDGDLLADTEAAIPPDLDFRLLDLERHLEFVYTQVLECAGGIDELKSAMNQRPAELLALEDRLTRALHYTPSDTEGLRLPTASQLRAKLREEGFLIDLATTTELLGALEHNRLVILEGPPGSGKTTLAKLLCKTLTGVTPDCAEVSAEWTRHDAIGGVRMIGKFFAAHLGAIARALLTSIESRGRHWLVLDEINRGDYASFLSGAHQLFELPRGMLTVDVLFPERSDPRGTLYAPPGFRVLGTMNPADRGRVFEISDALKRRARTVVLKAPPAEDEISLALLHAQRALETRSWRPNSQQLEELAATGLQFVQAIRDIGERGTGSTYARTNVGTWVFVDFIRSAALDLRSGVLAPGLHLALDKAISTTLLDRLSIDSPDLARQLLVAIADKDWPLTRGALDQRVRRTSSY